MLFILVIIYITFISLGLPDSLFGVVWPVLHTELGVAESFASVFMIIVAVCTGGVSFVAGIFIRRFGTSRVTFFSVLLTIIGLVGISFSVNIFMLIVFSVVLGFGAGAIDTGLNNYVSLHYKARHMSWLHCFWGIGVTTSPLIMSYFLAQGTWRGGYRTIALLQLLILLCIGFSLKKWRSQELSFVADLPEEIQTDGEKTKVNLFRFKGLIPCILSLGLYCSMEFMLGTWGATFLVNARDCAPDVAAKWVSLYYGGIMLGRFITGFLSIKLSDKQLVRYGIIIAFCGILLLALPLGTVSLVGLLLIGMGFGPVFPAVLHMVPQRFGAKYSADITGMHMGGAYAVGFSVQLTFGFVATATSFAITPYVILVICVLLLVDSEIANKLTSRGSSASATVDNSGTLVENNEEDSQESVLSDTTSIANVAPLDGSSTEDGAD